MNPTQPEPTNHKSDLTAFAKEVLGYDLTEPQIDFLKRLTGVWAEGKQVAHLKYPGRAAGKTAMMQTLGKYLQQALVDQTAREAVKQWDQPAPSQVEDTELPDQIYRICLLERYTDDAQKTARNQAQHIMALIQARDTRIVREAEERGVAWTVGVIDEFHSMPHTDGPIDRDRFYKGVKNGLRDRFRSETGIDPAPNYPVKAKLTLPRTKPEETES